MPPMAQHKLATMKPRLIAATPVKPASKIGGAAHQEPSSFEGIYVYTRSPSMICNAPHPSTSSEHSRMPVRNGTPKSMHKGLALTPAQQEVMKDPCFAVGGGPNFLTTCCPLRKAFGAFRRSPALFLNTTLF